MFIESGVISKPSAHTFGMSPEKARDKIESINKDSSHPWNPMNPAARNDKKAQKEYTRLYNIAFG